MDFNKIKLIIWDLDDTLWNGTISEGTVEIIKENVDLIKKTTNMGIIHSICSKNAYDVVEQYLSNKSLWEYFVFPSISWDSKGRRICDIIKSAKLRAENVLFIDDDPRNLEEAKHFSPGIMCLHSEKLSELYDKVRSAKVDKNSKSRLEQYKIIERKEKEKSLFDSNEDFLTICNIQVQMHCDCNAEIDRIAELVARSNQLNFTKKRQSRDELLELIESDGVSAGYVTVTDKFGDYGISGFYAIKSDELIHYTFSCRVLGMRIEQYVFLELGCPKLTIVGDVVAELNDYEMPFWINHSSTTNEETKESLNKRILLKGPCDMSRIFSFINDNESIATEFSYTNDAGILVEGHNHTGQIVTSLLADDITKNKLLDEFPFFDKKQFTTAMQNETFDYIVLSMLADGNLGLYRYKNSDAYVSLCEKHYDLTNEKNKSKYISKEIFTSSIDFTESDIDNFATSFEFVSNDGDITVSNLEIIRNYLNPSTKLILLLGAEKEFKKKCKPAYTNRHEEHMVMNHKIRKWAKKFDNVILIEIDHYIKSNSDYLDTINHFAKRVYYSMACDLVKIINTDLQSEITAKGIVHLYMAELERVVRKFKSLIKKLSH